ncbi:hypothetical protein GGX14DRAFT_388758 [Mycena pura]|uniref:Uncharacterized protein n=1 Tax=Mycena pura TaxID=153505 RepID=A0AAD6YK92_9AGAR|nr:hypothetical protein GGX14DRAFT_388758 [Mycena pura]
MPTAATQALPSAARESNPLLLCLTIELLAGCFLDRMSRLPVWMLLSRSLTAVIRRRQRIAGHGVLLLVDGKRGERNSFKLTGYRGGEGRGSNDALAKSHGAAQGKNACGRSPAAADPTDEHLTNVADEVSTNASDEDSGLRTVSTYTTSGHRRN